MRFNKARTEKGPKKGPLTVPMDSFLGRENREYLNFLIFPLPKSSLFGRSFAVFECVTQNTKETKVKTAPKDHRFKTGDKPVYVKDVQEGQQMARPVEGFTTPVLGRIDRELGHEEIPDRIVPITIGLIDSYCLNKGEL